jgi:hypothetical protein
MSRKNESRKKTCRYQPRSCKFSALAHSLAEEFQPRLAGSSTALLSPIAKVMSLGAWGQRVEEVISDCTEETRLMMHSEGATKNEQ